MAASSAAISYEVETESARKGVVVLLGRVFFSPIFVLAGLNHFSKPTIAFAASQGCLSLRSRYHCQESSRYWEE
jgi:hypothetical protein